MNSNLREYNLLPGLWRSGQDFDLSLGRGSRLGGHRDRVSKDESQRQGLETYTMLPTWL